MATKTRLIDRLPGLVVDLDGRQIQIEGHVCIEQGILEYLAVSAGGKEYESLFSLHCRPSHLHVSSMLIGLDAGELPPGLRGDYAVQADSPMTSQPEGAPQGTPPPKGYWSRTPTQPTRVRVEVEVLQDDGTWRRQPVEDFLIDRATGKPPAALEWAFTGSFFYKEPEMGLEYFVADVEKSLLALWYDPAALFNLTVAAGNPYRGEGAGFAVNPSRLPPMGTTVRLLLRAVPTK